MSNSTVRRDKLLRLARAGKLVLAESYSYDDHSGAVRSKEEREVAIIPEGQPDWWKSRREGVAYLFASDFQGSGRAYTDRHDPELIHLHVHSNCNYTFKIKK